MKALSLKYTFTSRERERERESERDILIDFHYYFIPLVLNCRSWETMPFRRRMFSSGTVHQGCQMVCFQTKNPNLGKFWRVLQWKILVFL
jgi:hypothetical protein